MEFIITILVIVAIFWLLRLLFPFIVIWLLKRQQKNWEQQFGQGRAQGGSPFGSRDPRARAQQRDKAKEGEIRVERMSGEHKRVKDNVGEDVEFEDIIDDPKTN